VDTGAVKAHGLAERPSEDIDFATGTAAPIEEIVAAGYGSAARLTSVPIMYIM
jgi:hypothetical protein